MKNCNLYITRRLESLEIQVSISLKHLTLSSSGERGGSSTFVLPVTLQFRNCHHPTASWPSLYLTYFFLLSHSGPEGSEFIARLLKENFYITELDLGQNKIKSPGAQAIAEVLTDNNTIKTLNLSWNDFKDKDAACLAEGIRVNQALTWLDLSHNEFAEEAGVLFGELYNK